MLLVTELWIMNALCIYALLMSRATTWAWYDGIWSQIKPGSALASHRGCVRWAVWDGFGLSKVAHPPVKSCDLILHHSFLQCNTVFLSSTLAQTSISLRISRACNYHHKCSERLRREWGISPDVLCGHNYTNQFGCLAVRHFQDACCCGKGSVVQDSAANGPACTDYQRLHKANCSHEARLACGVRHKDCDKLMWINVLLVRFIDSWGHSRC